MIELLALRAPDPASVGSLIDAVWGDRPPPSAAKTLQILVSRIRHRFPRLTITRIGNGYRLVDGSVDVQRFEELVVDGRIALDDGDTLRAVEMLSSARALWRGAPAPDVTDGPARASCVRLEELFRTLIEHLNEARLEAGGDAALIADLEAATAAEPLREQRWAHLMVGLCRDGRHAEALRAFQRARKTLGEQLGLEPTVELRALERAIVAEDPSLTSGSLRRAARQRTRRTDRGAGHRPTTMTTFVGRHDECRLVAKRLAEGRFVTVTGPGGVGKTRLALEVLDQVAQTFVDGVWFADLTPTSEIRSVASAIAEALGVREIPGTDLETSIIRHCKDAHGLLVLDNCEHVLSAVAGLVRHLLATSHDVCVLTTSRESLGVAGEATIPLGPLPTPPSSEHNIEDIAATDAVRLYADRAGAVDPEFHVDDGNAQAVAALCRHLDGLPLAIELAAGHAYVLGPAQIDAHLADRHAVLRSHDPTGPDRHRTLSALIDWSVERLEPAERTIFHRLSVFRGSMSLEAIDAVVTDDDVSHEDVLPALIRLVRSSLVVAEGTSATRRYRLFETIRQYGRDQLTADGDLSRRRDRHRDWALSWAADVAAGLRSEGQAQSLDILDEDYDNVETALEWSATDPDRATLACRTIQVLYDFWLARGTRRAQGVHWTMAIAEAAVGVPSAQRVRMMAYANVIIGQSDLTAAADIAATARRVAATTPDDERAALYAAIATCWTDVATGRPPDYSALAGASAQEPDDPDRNWIDAILSSCLAVTGDLEGGRLYIRRVVDHPRLLHDRHGRGSFLTFAVDIDAAIGDHLDRARADAREALDIATELACASCHAQALVSLLLVDRCDELGGPVATARRSLRLAHGIRETMGVTRALDMLVVALVAEGQPAAAVRIAAATATLRRRTGYAEHEPGRRAHRHSALHQAREQLTVERFDARWDAGRRLDYQRLLGELLDDDGPDT